MKMVLVAATENEINIVSTWAAAGLTPVNVLVTGIGSAITAHSLTRYILKERPDLVIQAGVAGSFREELSPGSVAFISKDIFADLGAVENEELVDMFDLGLAGINQPPYTAKWLVNPQVERWEAFGIPFLNSATVNRVTSNRFDAALIQKKYNPDIESMEGAALHYVCLKENVPFIQIRAISNYCGERNKKNWKMKEAIFNLNEELKRLILATKIPA